MANDLELIVWLTSSGLLGWLALDLQVPRLSRGGSGGSGGSVNRLTHVPPADNAADEAHGAPVRPLRLSPDIQAAVAASPAKLPLVLASDHVVELADCPHVLVAGASGSGKSVALHAMIQGLLARGNVTLWLIDPKKVEAYPYREHARVAFREDAAALLIEAVDTMNNRYDAMLRHGVRTWQGQPLVLVVDEYGDLLMGAKSERKAVETAIVRLAQMGRAAGVHLILATQRPSADVVTPLIRANVPARLALRCASAADSRIIRGDSEAYDRLQHEPKGSALWGDDLVRAPFVDPYA